MEQTAAVPNSRSPLRARAQDSVNQALRAAADVKKQLREFEAKLDSAKQAILLPEDHTLPSTSGQSFKRPTNNPHRRFEHERARSASANRLTQARSAASQHSRRIGAFDVRRAAPTSMALATDIDYRYSMDVFNSIEKQAKRVPVSNYLLERDQLSRERDTEVKSVLGNNSPVRNRSPAEPPNRRNHVGNLMPTNTNVLSNVKKQPPPRPPRLFARKEEANIIKHRPSEPERPKTKKGATMIEPNRIRPNPKDAAAKERIDRIRRSAQGRKLNQQQQETNSKETQKSRRSFRGPPRVFSARTRDDVDPNAASIADNWSTTTESSSVVSTGDGHPMPIAHSDERQDESSASSKENRQPPLNSNLSAIPSAPKRFRKSAAAATGSERKLKNAKETVEPGREERKRPYDSETLQVYMNRKRAERKRQATLSNINRVGKTPIKKRAYDSAAVKSYMKRKRQGDRQLKKVAELLKNQIDSEEKERIARALQEQEERSKIPSLDLLLEGLTKVTHRSTVQIPSKKLDEIRHHHQQRMTALKDGDEAEKPFPTANLSATKETTTDHQEQSPIRKPITQHLTETESLLQYTRPESGTISAEPTSSKANLIDNNETTKDGAGFVPIVMPPPVMTVQVEGPIPGQQDRVSIGDRYGILNTLREVQKRQNEPIRESESKSMTIDGLSSGDLTRPESGPISLAAEQPSVVVGGNEDEAQLNLGLSEGGLSVEVPEGELSRPSTGTVRQLYDSLVGAEDGLILSGFPPLSPPLQRFTFGSDQEEDESKSLQEDTERTPTAEADSRQTYEENRIYFTDRRKPAGESGTVAVENTTYANRPSTSAIVGQPDMTSAAGLRLQLASALNYYDAVDDSLKRIAEVNTVRTVTTVQQDALASGYLAKVAQSSASAAADEQTSSTALRDLELQRQTEQLERNLNRSEQLQLQILQMIEQDRQAKQQQQQTTMANARPTTTTADIGRIASEAAAGAATAAVLTVMKGKRKSAGRSRSAASSNLSSSSSVSDGGRHGGAKEADRDESSNNERSPLPPRQSRSSPVGSENNADLLTTSNNQTTLQLSTAGFRKPTAVNQQDKTSSVSVQTAVDETVTGSRSITEQITTAADDSGATQQTISTSTLATEQPTTNNTETQTHRKTADGNGKPDRGNSSSVSVSKDVSSSSLKSWKSEKKAFGGRLTTAARGLTGSTSDDGRTKRSDRQKLLDQRIAALQLYFAAQIAVVHAQKRRILSSHGGDQMRSGSAMSSRSHLESLEHKAITLQEQFARERANTATAIGATVAERDFVTEQKREIARLQALTLHQQWELERLKKKADRLTVNPEEHFGDFSDVSLQNVTLRSQTVAHIPAFEELLGMSEEPEWRAVEKERNVKRHRAAAEKTQRLRNDVERQEKELKLLELRLNNRPLISEPTMGDASTTQKRSRTTSEDDTTSEENRTVSPTIDDEAPTAKDSSHTPTKTSTGKTTTDGTSGSRSTTKNSMNEPPAVEKAAESMSRSSTPTEAAALRRRRRLSLPAVVSADREDSIDTMSISISEMAELESRVQALKSQLEEKRRLAEKLKDEYKRRTKDQLLSVEASRQRQLEAYNKFINSTQAQIDELERSTHGSPRRAGTPPRIMSPRHSLHDTSEGEAGSPRRVRTSPAPARAVMTSTVAASDHDSPPSEISEKDVKSSVIADAEKQQDEAKNEDVQKEQPIDVQHPPAAVTTEIPKLHLDTPTKPLIAEPQLAKEEVKNVDDKEETLKQVTSFGRSSADDEETEEDRRTENDVSSLSDEEQQPQTDVVPSSPAPSDKQEEVQVEATKTATQEKEPAEKAPTEVEPAAVPIVETVPVDRLSDALLESLMNTDVRTIVNLVASKQSRGRPLPLSVPHDEQTINAIDQTKMDRLISISKSASGEAVSADVRSPRSPPKSPSNRFTTSAAKKSPRSPRTIAVEARSSSSDDDERKPPTAATVIDDVVAVDSGWMDDDLGIRDEVPTTAAEDTTTSPGRRLQFGIGSSFTTDMFATVPCREEQLTELCQTAAAHLWKMRRYGETLSTAEMPNGLLVVAPNADESFDLSMNRDSDRQYRQLIFDWCKEITADIFADEERQPIDEQYAWLMKAPKINFSKYARIKPNSSDHLSIILKRNVVERLCSRGSTQSSLSYGTAKSRLKIISRKRLDLLDEMLLEEMYDEEQDWVDFEREELEVKLEMATEICGLVIEEEIDSVVKKILQIEIPVDGN